MKYTTIIFDLDGTLLNTLADLAAATNHALAEHKLPQRTTDEVRRFVGNGIRKLIERAAPADTPAELQEEVPPLRRRAAAFAAAARCRLPHRHCFQQGRLRRTSAG